MHTDRTVLGYIMPMGNFTWDINCIHLYICRSFCISGPLKCSTWPGTLPRSGCLLGTLRYSIPWPIKLMTHQMPKRCVKVWYNILKHAVGNLSGPKHHPLSSGKGIHSDVSYTIIIEQHHILNIPILLSSLYILLLL